MRTRSSFELKAPSSLHGLAEKVLLARKNCSPVRPRPTHLPACPLPAAYVDLCVFVCCRLLARTELRARRHVEHGRIPAPSRTSSTALGFAAARGVQSPNRVFAPSPRALLVCMLLPACPSASGMSFLHLHRCKWLEEAQARKIQGKIKSRTREAAEMDGNERAARRSRFCA